MPRIARGHAGGEIYHLINRGNGRQQVFHKDQDYQAFVKLLGEAGERIPVTLLAYCLMPNHFHLLVKPNSGAELSRWMQWLMTSHVRRYHRHYGTSGHVWQGRYKSFIVQEDGHLLTVIRYIEGNPVKANIVASATDWKWSSHAFRSMEGSSLGGLPIELPSQWTEYVNTPLTESELDKLQNSIDRQTPYGEEAWQVMVCRERGLESTMRKQGRPRKGIGEK